MPHPEEGAEIWGGLKVPLSIQDGTTAPSAVGSGNLMSRFLLGSVWD